MKRRLIISILLGSLSSSAALTGASDTRAPKLAILFSGWITGTFGFCGCKVEPNGGFPRRATFSRQYAEDFGAPLIQVDAGSLFAPQGPDATSINEAIFKALEVLPVAVLNLGSEDLYLWPQLVAQEGRRTRIISTNLVPRKASLKRPDRYAILTLKPDQTGLERDLRIGFMGFVDPGRVKPNSGFRGQDPVAALAETMPELAPQVDFVVLLADYFRRGPAEAGSLLHRIASDNDNIYAILTTERLYKLHKPVQINNAIILSSIERGRQLGRLVIELDAKGQVSSYEPDVVNLDASYPDDPELGELLRRLPGSLP